MSPANREISELIKREYDAGFVTDIEADAVAPGLNEDIIRTISAKKHEPQFMLDWRLQAYRHWLTMKEPDWANVHHPPIDYQEITYYSAPKSDKDGPKSLDEVDPKLLDTPGGAEGARGRRGRRRIRQRLRRHHVQGQAG
jgi:Fe-S cluster assembly protein SufB